MNRYALFLFSCYYPAGGWNDRAGLYCSFAEAKAFAEANPHDVAQIVDLHYNALVCEGGMQEDISHEGGDVDVFVWGPIAHYPGIEFDVVMPL